MARSAVGTMRPTAPTTAIAILSVSATSAMQPLKHLCVAGVERATRCTATCAPHAPTSEAMKPGASAPERASEALDDRGRGRLGLAEERVRGLLDLPPGFTGSSSQAFECPCGLPSFRLQDAEFRARFLPQRANPGARVSF